MKKGEVFLDHRVDPISRKHGICSLKVLHAPDAERDLFAIDGFLVRWLRYVRWRHFWC